MSGSLVKIAEDKVHTAVSSVTLTGKHMMILFTMMYMYYLLIVLHLQLIMDQ